MNDIDDLVDKIYTILEYFRKEALENSQYAPPFAAKEIIKQAVLETNKDWLQYIVNDLLNHDRDTLTPDDVDGFTKWTNKKVYTKVTEEHLEFLRKQGLVEFRTVDRNGNFSYSLTQEGKKLSLEKNFLTMITNLKR